MTVPTLPPRVPYPGLRPFEGADQAVFFGRESQVNTILHQLENHQFIALVGSSGSGKSSLVRAGLLPAVREGFLFGVEDWVISITKPGLSPYRKLAGALRGCENIPQVLSEARGERDGKAVSIGTGLILDTLQKSDLGLLNALQDMSLPRDRHVMVVIDQFEEIFAFRRASKRQEVTSRAEAAAFVNMLLRSSAEPESRIWVVLTMRSDFIGDCEAFLGLPEAVSRSQFLVPRLNRKQMEEAIMRPGEVGNAGFGQFTFQQNLVNRIINDVGDRQDQLPLMQHALMRTWKRALARDSAGEKLVLTHLDYEEAGEIEEALSKDVDEVWDKIKSDPKKALLARRLFLLLCDVSPEMQINRRRSQVGEVMAVTGATVAEVEEVVREFQADDRNFLLPPFCESFTPDTYLDVSHETLLRRWRRFSLWLENERTAVAELRRLVDRARLHLDQRGALLQSKDLDRVTQWQEHNLCSLPWAQRYVTSDQWNEAQHFIAMSAEKVKQRETSKLRRRVAATIAAGVALILLVILVLFVLKTRMSW